MNRASAILSSVLVSLALPAGGQDSRTIGRPSIELDFARNVWFSSSNPAGMTIDTLNRYNIVSACYRHTSGDFKRLQRGDRETGVDFSTDGALRVKGISLWGSFSFSNEYWKGTQYNTNRFFPSLDMPYYVADPNKGDWNRQLYDMTVKAAFPMLWDRVVFGARASYMTYKGAKQIDPRGVPIGYAIEVEPAAVIRLSGRHFAGITFLYRNGFERNTFSNVQGNSTMVYLMKGLGNFSSGSVAGTGGIGNYYYPSDTFGGSIQYSFLSDSFRLMAEGGYARRRDDAFQNPATAYRMGTTESGIFSAKLRTVWGKSLTHSIKGDFSFTDIDGKEYLQEQSGSGESDPYVILAVLDMSSYSHIESSLAYDMYVTRDTHEGWVWNFGAEAGFRSRNDMYSVPLSVFSYSGIYGTLHASRQMRVKERHRLSAALEGGYSCNLSGGYTYGGADASHRVVTEFYSSEHAYLTSSYAMAGCTLGYAFMFDRSSVGIDLSGRALLPGDSRSRMLITAELYWTF